MGNADAPHSIVAATQACPDRRDHSTTYEYRLLVGRRRREGVSLTEAQTSLVEADFGERPEQREGWSRQRPPWQLKIAHKEPAPS